MKELLWNKYCDLYEEKSEMFETVFLYSGDAALIKKINQISFICALLEKIFHLFKWFDLDIDGSL